MKSQYVLKYAVQLVVVTSKSSWDYCTSEHHVYHTGIYFYQVMMVEVSSSLGE